MQATAHPLIAEVAATTFADQMLAQGSLLPLQRAACPPLLDNARYRFSIVGPTWGMV